MSKAPVESVKVMVRVRPMNTKEKNQGSKSIVRVDRTSNMIELYRPQDEGAPSKNFSFDSVYDIDS